MLILAGHFMTGAPGEQSEPAHEGSAGAENVDMHGAPNQKQRLSE
jgi:hypothetical protein